MAAWPRLVAPFRALFIARVAARRLLIFTFGARQSRQCACDIGRASMSIKAECECRRRMAGQLLNRLNRRTAGGECRNERMPRRMKIGNLAGPVSVAKKIGSLALCPLGFIVAGLGYRHKANRDASWRSHARAVGAAQGARRALATLFRRAARANPTATLPL